MSESPTFILAGNGPYDNRGCEAIVRGTVKILRHYYKDPSFLCVSFFQNQEQFEKQCQEEYDPVIIHERTNKRGSKFDPKWISRVVVRNIYQKPYRNWIYKNMFQHIKSSNAVLSVGGDNYSLDYGIPTKFTYLDDIALENQKPLIIWGASIGPFDKNPKYEKYMINHLQNVSGIFARESVTIEYLKENGVTDNVYRVADPAFLMDPTEPKINDSNLVIDEEAIGINLSPLMSKYVTNGNLNQWVTNAAEIISQVSEKTSRTIYLIPHVTTNSSNDYIFMKEVLATIKRSKDRIILIPPIYNASETKWIISKMKLFAGARTHATIAALSSGVPTLSFGYSIKATGINRDIFGHDFYCLNPDGLSAEKVVKKIEEMVEKNKEIRKTLCNKIPEVQNNAMRAGKYLKTLI